MDKNELNELRRNHENNTCESKASEECPLMEVLQKLLDAYYELLDECDEWKAMSERAEQDYFDKADELLEMTLSRDKWMARAEALERLFRRIRLTEPERLNAALVNTYECDQKAADRYLLALARGSEGAWVKEYKKSDPPTRGFPASADES